MKSLIITISTLIRMKNMILNRMKAKQARTNRRTRIKSRRRPNPRLFALQKGWPSENLTFLKFRTWSYQFPLGFKRRTAFYMPYLSIRTTIPTRDCCAWSSISSKAVPWRGTYESWETRSSKSKMHQPDSIPPVSSAELNSKAALKFWSGSSRKRSLIKWPSSTSNMDSLMARRF